MQMVSLRAFIFTCLGLTLPAFGLRAEEAAAAEALERETEETEESAPSKGACWDVGFQQGPMSDITTKKYIPTQTVYPMYENDGHPCTKDVGTEDAPDCAGITLDAMEYAVEGSEALGEALKKICGNKGYNGELTVYVPQEQSICLMQRSCSWPVGTVKGSGDYWMKYPAAVARKCSDGWGCREVNRHFKDIERAATREKQAAKAAAAKEARMTKANKLKKVLGELNMCDFAPGDDKHPWGLKGMQQQNLTKALKAAGVELKFNFNEAIRKLKTELAEELNCKEKA